MSLIKKGKEVINTWNQKDLSALAALYGEHIPFFDPLLNKAIKGKEIIHYAKSIYEAFPDLEFVIDHIAEGEQVVMVQWRQCGVNSGPVLGKPATNRYIEIPAVSVLNFKDGNLIAHRDFWDMKQLAKDLFK